VTDPAKAQLLYDLYQNDQNDLLHETPVAFLYDDRNVFVLNESVGGFENTPEHPAVIF
jgi:ABC-type transport system substrate-binding protein